MNKEKELTSVLVYKNSGIFLLFFKMALTIQDQEL